MFWTGGGADDTNPPGRLPPNNTPLSVCLPEYVWDRSPGHEITNVTKPDPHSHQNIFATDHQSTRTSNHLLTTNVIKNVYLHRLLKCQVKENCSHVKLSLHIKTVSSMASYPLTSESFPGARLIVAPRLPLIFDSHLCLSFLPLASHFSSLPLIFTSHLCLLPLPLIFASCLLSLTLIFVSCLSFLTSDPITRHRTRRSRPLGWTRSEKERFVST